MGEMIKMRFEFDRIDLERQTKRPTLTIPGKVRAFEFALVGFI